MMRRNGRNKNEAGLLRKTKNPGVFEHLTERMSKKRIRDLAKEYDISLDGLKLNIDFNEELLRTLFHEKQHVEQSREFGTEYVQENKVYFERITEVLEEEFVSRLKKEGRL